MIIKQSAYYFGSNDCHVLSKFHEHNFKRIVPDE